MNQPEATASLSLDKTARRVAASALFYGSRPTDAHTLLPPHQRSIDVTDQPTVGFPIALEMEQDVLVVEAEDSPIENYWLHSFHSHSS